MTWLAAIFLGLLIGVMAAVYAGGVAILAADWLRVSSFEGYSGYWIFAMGLLGFLGGAIGGAVICRTLGFGYAVLIVGGVISVAGGWAWMQRNIEPKSAMNKP
jgi:hypothetical protein